MPGTDEWVLVLGEADEAGHWKLGGRGGRGAIRVPGPRVRDWRTPMTMVSSRSGPRAMCSGAS